MMHHDAVCQAFWSCRSIAEKTLAELEQHRNGIVAAQELLTSEEHTPLIGPFESRHESREPGWWGAHMEQRSGFLRVLTPLYYEE
jgi:hypothetical protein